MVSRVEDAVQQQESVTFSTWEGGRKNTKYMNTFGGSKMEAVSCGTDVGVMVHQILNPSLRLQ